MVEFCPRSISFTIPGVPGVQVTAVENGKGDIDFTVDVINSSSLTGDLRGLFFQFNEGKLSTLEISNPDKLITDTQIKANKVIDLGNGANMNGAASPFDVGIEFGTPGIGHGDDISFPVHFTLSDAAHDLTLDDLAHLQFGARVNSIGISGGSRSDSEKIVALAPAAPDAKDDTAKRTRTLRSRSSLSRTTSAPMAILSSSRKCIRIQIATERLRLPITVKASLTHQTRTTLDLTLIPTALTIASSTASLTEMAARIMQP